MRKLRDILVGLIVICMVTTLIPVNAFASEASGIENGVSEQINETTDDVQSEEDKTIEQTGLSEEEIREQELFEKYGDDPGNGRLTGNIPAGFYDEIAMFSTRASYTHNSRFENYTIQKGIDVSHHQGKIDWKKVKAAGIQFAIIRVGYRGYGEEGNIGNDTRAVENMKGAIAAGIPIGVYIYSQAITEAEAKAEANYVLNNIKGYKIELPIVMDYEYYSGANGESGRLHDAKLSKRKATNNCLAFCKVVEDAGYDAMVYANKSFLTNQLYASEISSKYEVWLANYTTSTSYAGEYTYWQYTSSGKVNGINGNVDMNFRYVAPDMDPYKLEVSSKTLNSVTLQWKDNTIVEEDADGYEIEKKNSVGQYELLAEISEPSQLTYTDEGLSQGTAYTYRVRAVYINEYEKPEEPVIPEESEGTEGAEESEESGEPVKPEESEVLIEKAYGEYSKAVTAVTGIDTTTAITGAKPTYDSVTITWNKAEDVSGYQILRYNLSRKNYDVIGNVSGVSYKDSGLKINTAYTYRVVPYKKVGSTTVYGVRSSKYDIKTLTPSTAITNTKVNIRTGASTSKKVLKTVGKGTRLSVTGTSGDWYKVSITISGKAKTGYIMKKYVKIATAPAKTTVTAKGTAFDKVKVSWKKVSGASGYVVQRYNSSKKAYETIKTVTKGTTVAYTDGNCNCNTNYKYRVCAYKTYYGTKVYGAYSTVASGKTKTYVKGKTTTKVKVRKGAGTSYKSYKTVKKGTKFNVTGSKGSWYRVSIHIGGKKKNAYIMKKYIKL